MKKKVLIHTLIFPPDQVSTSYLYGDIVQSLLKNGYEVLVITTFPHYNYNDDFFKVSEKAGFWRTTDYHGAKVFHFPQEKSSNPLIRGSYLVLFHLAFILKSIFIGKIDFILTPSPPLTSGLLSGLVAKLKGAKSIYNVQEIYPDVLIKQGAIRSKFIIKSLKILENLTYKVSEKVVPIDHEFSKTLYSRMKVGKLVTIPNFIDTNLYKPIYSKLDPRLDFDGKYIVGYLGNLGKVQDWDLVLDTIKALTDHKNIHFLIVGGGSEFDKLKLAELKFSNLTVWDYQSRDFVPQINARVNLHFIAMNQASDLDGLPSKTFAILASGRPILAVTSVDSPLSRLLNESGNGLRVDLGDVDAFKQGIVKASDGMFFSEETNLKGREFVIENYSKETVTSKYVQLLNELN